MPVTIGGSGPITGVTSINTTVSDTELGYLDGVTSALQTQLAGKADISGNGAWTSHTPALTAATTNPTLGTGSAVEGAYMQVGKLVIYRFTILFGSSGVAAGTGAYRVSLPVTAKVSSTTNIYGSTCLLYDSSTTNAWIAGANIPTGSTGAYAQMWAGAGGPFSTIGAAAPWTWAAADQIHGTITYEAA